MDTLTFKFIFEEGIPFYNTFLGFLGFSSLMVAALSISSKYFDTIRFNIRVTNLKRYSLWVFLLPTWYSLLLLALTSLGFCNLQPVFTYLVSIIVFAILTSTILFFTLQPILDRTSFDKLVWKRAKQQYLNLKKEEYVSYIGFLEEEISNENGKEDIEKVVELAKTMSFKEDLSTQNVESLENIFENFYLKKGNLTSFLENISFAEKRKLQNLMRVTNYCNENESKLNHVEARAVFSLISTMEYGLDKKMIENEDLTRGLDLVKESLGIDYIVEMTEENSIKQLQFVIYLFQYIFLNTMGTKRKGRIKIISQAFEGADFPADVELDRTFVSAYNTVKQLLKGFGDKDE